MARGIIKKALFVTYRRNGRLRGGGGDDGGTFIVLKCCVGTVAALSLSQISKTARNVFKVCNTDMFR